MLCLFHHKSNLHCEFPLIFSFSCTMFHMSLQNKALHKLPKDTTGSLQKQRKVFPQVVNAPARRLKSRFPLRSVISHRLRKSVPKRQLKQELDSGSHCLFIRFVCLTYPLCKATITVCQLRLIWENTWENVGKTE